MYALQYAYAAAVTVSSNNGEALRRRTYARNSKEDFNAICG